MTVHNIQEKIIKRINKGDAKAFEQLYSIFYVYLCAVATKYIYNAEIAKEIVNDVFLSVWDNRETLLSPVKPYLVKATRNRCLNHLRKQRLQELPLTDIQEQMLSIQEQLLAEDQHPLALLENKEFEQSVFEAIQKLPPKCRDIFMQYVYENKSYEEIAEANSLASSTVRVQIKIAITKLKDMFGDYSFLLLFF